jgi:putative ABC transport system substrate-binding protein
MRRRDFITLIGGASAWPLTALAQQSDRLIRLGFLGPTLNNPATTVPYEAFRTALGQDGFREGQNLIINYQSVDDPRGPFVVAAELTRSRPDLIVASGPEASLQAVMGVSGLIPVVMIAINFDPLARGYIASLARPGGNITGVVFQQLELAQKQVELLNQAFSTARVHSVWPLAVRAQQAERMRRIGVLMNRAADDPEGQARRL